MEEEEPKEAVRCRVGGDGDEVRRGSNTLTEGSRLTSNRNTGGTLLQAMCGGVESHRGRGSLPWADSQALDVFTP